MIAYGVLRWVDYTVSDASYFKLNTDHTPLHLVLIDEVGFMYSSTNIYSIDLLITVYVPAICTCIHDVTYRELDNRNFEIMSLAS